ncbi:unnamed protein product [Amoebophrya sp. A120]|nr:unnamed protein product [Amoebophrya sp. A120]|eukprot:GSA120T00016697001.1
MVILADAENSSCFFVVSLRLLVFNALHSTSYFLYSGFNMLLSISEKNSSFARFVYLLQYVNYFPNATYANFYFSVHEEQSLIALVYKVRSFSYGYPSRSQKVCFYDLKVNRRIRCCGAENVNPPFLCSCVSVITTFLSRNCPNSTYRLAFVFSPVVDYYCRRSW